MAGRSSSTCSNDELHGFGTSATFYKASPPPERSFKSFVFVGNANRSCCEQNEAASQVQELRGADFV